MPVKKGGTAMQNWFRAVWSPSSFPLADSSPRGSDTTDDEQKAHQAQAQRHQHFGGLAATCTGWRY